MTKAQDFAARAAKVAGTTTKAKAPAVRTAPVKMTVELDPGLYSFVKAFPEAQGIPAALGKVRVPTVEVFRALLEELEEDPDLAGRVAGRVRDNLAA
jgi:hypothetical protein